MLRAVVIDDIDTIRTKNCDLIKATCPNIALVGQANSVVSGVQLIQQVVPDLVFLDVEMPDGTGFDLLQRLAPFAFKVIFVTGYEDFAIRAFRFSAVDYLLKPLDPKELSEAVSKAEEAHQKEVWELKFNTLLTNLERPIHLQKLVLRTAERIYSVNIQDIVRCESDKNYTTFFLINGSKLLVSKTLKDYETLLQPLHFFRCHQSHLINMLYFDHFVKSDGGNTIVMKNKSVVPLSTRKKEEFLLLLDSL